MLRDKAIESKKSFGVTEGTNSQTNVTQSWKICKMLQEVINDKDNAIFSMSHEIEELQNMLSNTINDQISMQYIEYDLLNKAKQVDIMHDLELSHANTKLKLLEETLNNRNNDISAMENYKKNNEQLLKLLERYDNKVSSM